jgi:hypothetical protein
MLYQKMGWDTIPQCHIGLISQHTPSVHAVYTHLIGEVFMLLACESFGEDISGLVIGGDVLEVDGLGLVLLVQEVVADLDVLGVVMKFGVASDGNSGLVVNEESDC